MRQTSTDSRSTIEDTSLDFTAPITDRLRRRDTGLRMTADASLLVQSLLDLSKYNELWSIHST